MGGGSGRLFCMQRPGVNHSYHPVSRLWAHQKRHQWFSSSQYHLSTSTLVSLTSWCCLLRRDPPAAFINILPPLRCTHFHLRMNRLRRLTSFITSLASQQSHQSPPPVSPLYWVGGVISLLLGAHAPTIIKFPFGVEALKHFWQDLIITSSGVKSKYLDCILLPLPRLWVMKCCGTTVRSVGFLLSSMTILKLDQTSGTTYWTLKPSSATLEFLLLLMTTYNLRLFQIM